MITFLIINVLNLNVNNVNNNDTDTDKSSNTTNDVKLILDVKT